MDFYGGHSPNQLVDRYQHPAPDHFKHGTDVLAKRRFPDSEATRGAPKVATGIAAR